jgi:hypothetical protein
MAGGWFIARGNERIGPYTAQQLQELADSGQLRPMDTLHWEMMPQGVPGTPDQGPGVPGAAAPSALPALEVLLAESAEAGDAKQPQEEDVPMAQLAGPPADPAKRLLDNLGSLARRAQEKFQEVGGKLKDAVKDTKLGSAVLATGLAPRTAAPAAQRPRLAGPGGGGDPPLAEVTATYLGGHPEFVTRAGGVLRLDAVGLEFAPEDATTPLHIGYEKIVNILEPRQGEFPEGMLKSAQVKKTAAGVLKAAAGLVEVASSHKAMAALGKGVAGGVGGAAELGSPPKNRLYVLVTEAGVKYKLIFDVVAATREQLETQAQTFWNLSARVRGRFSKPATGAAAKPTAPPPDAPLSAA